MAETAVPEVASTSTTCRSMSPEPVSVATIPPDTPEVLDVVLTTIEPPAAAATMATPEVVLTGPAALTVTLSVESVPVEVARMPPVEPMTAPWVSTVTAPPGPEPPGVLVAAMPQPPDFDSMVEAPPNTFTSPLPVPRMAVPPLAVTGAARRWPEVPTFTVPVPVVEASMALPASERTPVPPVTSSVTVPVVLVEPRWMPTSPSTEPPAVVSRMVPLVCSKVP